MKVLWFVVVLFCLVMLATLDVAECRRRPRKKGRRRNRNKPISTAMPTTTTPLTSRLTTMLGAPACRIVCEGDSFLDEDSCSCSCRQDGFGYNPHTGQCEDVDECKNETVCSGGICVNMPGSYRCMCSEGYNLHASGKMCLPAPKVLPCRGLQCFDGAALDEDRCRCKCSIPGLKYDYFMEECVDIDECAKGIAGCQQTCLNTIGSFRCQCNKDFRLNYDRVSCDPVDPDCRDIGRFCGQLASAVECLYNPNIRSMCPKTCRVCVG